MPFDNNTMVLATENIIDTADLGSSDFVNSSFPLANLKDRLLSRTARTGIRSANGQPVQSSATIYAGFPKLTKLNCVSIIAHNLSSVATVGFSLYSDLGATIPVYQSGFNPVNGPLKGNDLGLTPLTTNLFDNVQARSMVLSVIDTNPDLYIEWGRVFVGDAFQPKINMSYGVELGTRIRTTVEETLSGVDYFDSRRPRRTAAFSLESLSEDEWGSVFRIQRLMGIDKEMIFFYTPNKLNPNYTARTFLCRNEEVSPITHPFLNRHANPMSLVEII